MTLLPHSILPSECLPYFALKSPGYQKPEKCSRHQKTSDHLQVEKTEFVGFDKNLYANQ